jgi:plasmid stability protein
MPALHVRNLDDALIAALKERARRNHRSLQGEVRSILEAAATGERPAGMRVRRRLSLRTVSVGQAPSFSRDVIYENDDH